MMAKNAATWAIQQRMATVTWRSAGRVTNHQRRAQSVPAIKLAKNLFKRAFEPQARGSAFEPI